MRELFRTILSANLTFTGLLLFAGSVLTFYGSVYLLKRTNLGRRLAFLLSGAGLFGWMIINSLFFVLYAPRGPRPVDIEGLNAFEIRIIPFAYLIVSAILFVMFLVALDRYEKEQERVGD